MAGVIDRASADRRGHTRWAVSASQRGAARGKQLDAYFDLVVVDEASQMNLAEAVTAAAFLRDDGQFIAVGDHRQMPPIVQHTWDQASRRDLARARPSPCLRTSWNSASHARPWMNRFASRPKSQTFSAPCLCAGRHCLSFPEPSAVTCRPGLDGWLRHALAPEHPIILIEHNDDSSQQAMPARHWSSKPWRRPRSRSWGWMPR